MCPSRVSKAFRRPMVLVFRVAEIDQPPIHPQHARELTTPFVLPVGVASAIVPFVLETRPQCKGKHSKAYIGDHNVRGVLLDTQGPEIRTGNLEGGERIALVQGSTIELTTDPVRDGAC